MMRTIFRNEAIITFVMDFIVFFLITVSPRLHFVYNASLRSVTRSSHDDPLSHNRFAIQILAIFQYLYISVLMDEMGKRFP